MKAQKPVRLLTRLISIYCPEEGWVLEPFMGTGPALRAARECHCNAIGVEKNPVTFVTMRSLLFPEDSSA